MSTTLLRPGRIPELDATRGAAMLAVCLSHSAYLVGKQWWTTLGYALLTVGMIATPTFLLLSGIVCGYLSATRKGPARAFRWYLVDRGLFLLLVVHSVLGLLHVVWRHDIAALTGSFYITDAVGVGLVVGAIVVGRLSPRLLVTMGASLLLVSWTIANLEPTGTPAARNLVRLLFGLYESGTSEEGYIVPVIPYLGIFIIGMAAGLEYARRRAAGESMEKLAGLCIRSGLIGVAIACVVKVAWLVGKPLVAMQWRDLVYHLTEPRQKLPPGPAYLLAYAGAGAVLTGITGKLNIDALGSRFVALFAVVGRASLFVFVAQYVIYFVPALGFHLGAGTWFWSFPVSLVVLWGLAWAWDAARGNRLLTLGIGRAARTFSRRSVPEGESR